VVKTLDVYIAVPHDLPNQKLMKEPAFQPTPVGFVSDRWGQKCAHFVFKDIAAGQSVAAVMTVEATLYKVRWYVDPAKVGGLDEIPAEIRRAYTQDSSKLVVGDPVIQTAVKDALKGESNPYWMAWKINKYIQDHMYYELAGGWNVAPVVLARGSGSCSEYSFVMLAMCHAAGLPARYAGSVVIRGDDASRDDVFHRWVEVYLPNYGWFPVDPSGGDSDVPARVSDFFGGLANRFVITTLGAGDSETLGWDYDSAATWTAQGRVKLMQEKAGDWVPAGNRVETALPTGH
jgi:Transglutaminase-like superfamily